MDSSHGPSHVSLPVYGPAICVAVAPVAVIDIVALQIGVGSDWLPEGKIMFSETVLPVIVPVNVPSLFMWHEEQVPSSGSTARVCTVPDSAVPLCATVIEIV